MNGLRYVGVGHIVGVPARDLSEEEAEEHGREALVASGLYVEAKGKPRPAENKVAAGPTENKSEVRDGRD